MSPSRHETKLIGGTRAIGGGGSECEMLPYTSCYILPGTVINTSGEALHEEQNAARCPRSVTAVLSGRMSQLYLLRRERSMTILIAVLNVVAVMQKLNLSTMTM